MTAHRPRPERAAPRSGNVPIIGLLLGMLFAIGILLLLRAAPSGSQSNLIASLGASETTDGVTYEVSSAGAVVETEALGLILERPEATPTPLTIPEAPAAADSTPTPLPLPPTAVPTLAPAIPPTSTPEPQQAAVVEASVEAEEPAAAAAPSNDVASQPAAAAPAAQLPEATAAPIPEATAEPVLPEPTATPFIVEPTATPFIVEATATPEPTATSSPATRAGDSIASMEAWMVGEVNAVRAKAGLSPLTANSELAAIARDWSAQMAAVGAISHRPGNQLGAMMPPGWFAWAENVATAPDVYWAQSALEGSTGHYANMVGGNYNTIGIGIVISGNGQIWVTQNFGGY